MDYENDADLIEIAEQDAADADAEWRAHLAEMQSLFAEIENE